MSGGNQQKVVLGKWLSTEPSLLILDEPTRGIDVGAKAEIRQKIDALAADGMAILLVSSELPEIMGMSDRILVMRNGCIVAEFARADFTEEAIGTAAIAGLSLESRANGEIRPRTEDCLDGSAERRRRGPAVEPYEALRNYGIYIVLALLVIGFSIVAPGFASVTNFILILLQVSVMGILSIGMLFVILSRGIDLSVGSILAIAGIFSGLIARQDLTSPMRRSRLACPS